MSLRFLLSEAGAILACWRIFGHRSGKESGWTLKHADCRHGRCGSNHILSGIRRSRTGFVLDSTGTLNSIYHPFSSGAVISIWVTGGGMTSTPIADGQIYNTLQPLADSVSVQIGGFNAKVAYAGLFCGSPGVMQINAAVPAGVEPGTAVPLQIVVGGHPSQAGITIAIK